MALQQNHRPAYEVHPYTGSTVRKVYTFDKVKGLQSKEVKDTGGFMVYFPKGHSIRLRTEAELKAHGFDMPASIVDMDTGDDVGVMPDKTLLKRRSSMMTKATRSGENLEADE